MTPEPMPCSGARNAVSVLSLSLLSAKPLVSTCTTDLVTSDDNACTDSLNTCSGSFLSALAASAVRVGCSVCAAQNTGAVVSAAMRMATIRPDTSIHTFYGKPGAGSVPAGYGTSQAPCPAAASALQQLFPS